MNRLSLDNEGKFALIYELVVGGYWLYFQFSRNDLCLKGYLIENTGFDNDIDFFYFGKIERLL
jgi:hypothetical protein